MEKRITELGKSYWNENGAYQEEFDKLYKELVPSKGEADTIHGEMIRAVSRLFYDFCNNGNCNVIERNYSSCPDCYGSGYEDEDCYGCDGNGEVEYENDEFMECTDCGGSGTSEMDCGYCGGSGEIDGEIEFNEYYQDMIDFLNNHMNNLNPVGNLIDFLQRDDLGYGSYTFNSNEMKVYNDLVDEIMHQVLTTENEKRIAIS